MFVETVMLILIWKHYTIYPYTETLHDTHNFVHLFSMSIIAICIWGAGEWTQSFISTEQYSTHWAPLATSFLFFFLWSSGWGQTEGTALPKQELYHWSPIILSEAKLATGNESFPISTHYLALSWLLPFRIRNSHFFKIFCFLLIGMFFLFF